MTRPKIRLLGLLLILVPIGITMKFYQGPGAEWVSIYLIKVVFVVFWCLLFQLVLNTPAHLSIAAAVFLLACGFELLQLWDPFFVQVLTNTPPGQILLGGDFSWNAFPYYFVGGALGHQILNAACTSHE